MLSQVIYQSHKIPFIGEDEKYHYLYKITNMINGKIYIGIHSTTDLNDRYMGSGKKLLNAFKKYGIKNFNKEILCFCNTREEICQLEKEIVNEEFIKREDVYNLNTGGQYGLHSEETKHKISESNKGEISWAKGKIFSKEHRERISKSRVGYKHSDASKRKVSEARKRIIANSTEKQPNKRTVIKTDIDGNVIEIYNTLKEAAALNNNVTSPTLRRYIRKHILYNDCYFEYAKLKEVSNE